MAETAWMVRSDAGALFEAFKNGTVAIGWAEIGDLSVATSRDAVRAKYEDAYPDDLPGHRARRIHLQILTSQPPLESSLQRIPGVRYDLMSSYCPFVVFRS